MGYINIKEVYGIPLSLQISMEQADALADNLAKSYRGLDNTCEMERKSDDYGTYYYYYTKIPTYTVEELLANARKKGDVHTTISLEELMWGLYYYIQQKFNKSFVEKSMNSDKHKQVVRMIVDKIILDDAAPSLISYYLIMQAQKFNKEGDK